MGHHYMSHSMCATVSESSEAVHIAQSKEMHSVHVCSMPNYFGVVPVIPCFSFTDHLNTVL